MAVHPFDLNIRHLRALVAIVACKSMSAAAETISLSQPALTQGLAKLERQLGVRLCHRRSEGARATAKGLVLAERSAAALAHLAAAMCSATRTTRGFSRPEHMVTATQLRAFLSLADAGSFAAAAKATGLSQSALHRAVRDLEQISTAILVERRGRCVALTDAGLRLARGTRLAAREIDAALVEIMPQATDRYRLTIGAMPLCRAVLLPRAIAALTRSSPQVTLDIVEGAWRELIDPLRDGLIDMVIGALRDDPQRDVEQRPLFLDRLVVVGRVGHPLAAIAAPTLAQLADYPWVIGREGAPLRVQWQALFDGMALPRAPVECGSVMTIRGILRDSDFLTLLSPEQVALEIEAKLLAIIGPPLTDSVRRIGVTTRTGWRLTAGQQALVDLLVEETLREGRAAIGPIAV